MVVEGLTSVHQRPFKLKVVVISNMVVCEIKKILQTLELEQDKLEINCDFSHLCLPWKCDFA